ncbi:hypothetical protein CDAR_612231 [Caerostris darwini]|uniref:Uncharacterized protein n=1 Tax=Caerostris darwini TaxID=1538125 RepID=A0AAV4S2H2_9ARAC|nr:hypothetical protein CDAR_612231 [Caerostris darwini]
MVIKSNEFELTAARRTITQGKKNKRLRASIRMDSWKERRFQEMKRWMHRRVYERAVRDENKFGVSEALFQQESELLPDMNHDVRVEIHKPSRMTLKKEPCIKNCAFASNRIAVLRDYESNRFHSLSCNHWKILKGKMK